MSTKMTAADLIEMKRRGERIVTVAAYDAPSARFAEAAGVDVILVGDSAAMTVLGYDSTLPITMDEMVMLTRAVTRGARQALVVADLPFGSFQVSDEATLEHAVRFVKEGGADAVKIEGAGRSLDRVRALSASGVAVMGHVGLTPQAATSLGGHKAQGRSAAAARRVYDAAMALEDAGCFAVVLEAIPANVAARITSALTVPTIGIGAGPSCSGQVLVWHDLLGLTSGHLARFVKRYADLGPAIVAALSAYAGEVRAGSYPSAEHTYSMPDLERQRFETALDAAIGPRADAGSRRR